MSSESMNYVRRLIEKAYYDGASEACEAIASFAPNAFPRLAISPEIAARNATDYARRARIDEKALRCGNSERAQSEEATRNLQAVPTTPDASAQLPPLAADLEGLAVSLGILAGKVSAEEWEFLKIFRANLRAAAERVAALETSLEAPHV